MSTVADPAIPVALQATSVGRRRIAFASVVAMIAGAAGWLTFAEATFTGRVLLHARSYHLNANTADSRSRMQTELLLRRSFYTRVVADPSVASLPSIRAHADPASLLEASLQVHVLERGWLELLLPGDDANEVTVVLDRIARMHVEDATQADRGEHNDIMRKLESSSILLRSEIQSRERAINLTIEANSTGSAHPGDELARLNADVQRIEQEVGELTLRIGREKKADEIESLKDKRQIATELLTIRKRFRDEYEKNARQSERSRIAIESVQGDLIPMREAVHDLERRRIALQIERDLDPSLVIREPAFAIRSENPRPRVLRTAVYSVVAFAGALLLGFGLFRPRVK